MNELDKKIIRLFKIIYDVNTADIEDIINILKTIDVEWKKEILLSMYKRYKTMKNNYKFITREIDHTLEKISAEENILTFNF